MMPLSSTVGYDPATGRYNTELKVTFIVPRDPPGITVVEGETRYGIDGMPEFFYTIHVPPRAEPDDIAIPMEQEQDEQDETNTTTNNKITHTDIIHIIQLTLQIIVIVMVIILYAHVK